MRRLKSPTVKPDYISTQLLFSLFFLFLQQSDFEQKRCHCELERVRLACHHPLRQPANSVIRLIVLAINLNPDMKEFEGGCITNYSRSLQPVFRVAQQRNGFNAGEWRSGG